MNPILVIAEILGNRIGPVTLELVSAARMIRDSYPGGSSDKGGDTRENNSRILIVVPHRRPVPLADQLAADTGLDTIALSLPDTRACRNEVVKEALVALMKKTAPSHVLAAHTALGREIAPGLAVRLGAASIAGVIGIRSCSPDGGAPVFTRPVMDNTRVQAVEPDPNLPAVLTLVPGAFPRFSGKAVSGGRVLEETAAIDLRKLRTVQKKHLKPVGSSQALKSARVVVAAGRGIGEKENLGAVSQFAGAFPSSALAASRPLVDMGWIGYERQVGVTGASVSPDLYIACGISGSSQHLAGIKDAKYVVSINKNPDAPICRHSDLCITADVMAFIREFQLKSGEGE